MNQKCTAIIAAGVAIVIGALASEAAAQADLANRPIKDVRVEGLKRVGEQLVRNQIRSAKGTAYDPKKVEQDIRRITQLGHFSSVKARVMPQKDGTVVLIYDLVEQTILADVRVVGNKAFPDAKILGYFSGGPAQQADSPFGFLSNIFSGAAFAGQRRWVPGYVLLRAGDGADQFLIEKGMQRIKDEYHKEGYFQAEVTFDEDALKESNILIYRIREGAAPRIREIRIEGNTIYSDRELKGQIKSETAFLFLRKGHLSREALDNDVARIRDYYRDRGYLEAEVGRRIDVSPNQQHAAVVFFVEEGPLYTVATIEVEGSKIFSKQAILERLALKVGDVYAANKVRQSERAVRDMYGKLGYIEMRLVRTDGKEGIDRKFHEKAPKVDVFVRIVEARPHFVGPILVRGNAVTKDRVILQEVRLEPGRRFDRSAIEKTERRLREHPVFSDAKVTVLGTSDDEYRPVLVDVRENPRPGTLSFGAALSSDAGVLGAIDLVQRNFDLFDFPEDFSELISGKAFRGAGQFFALTLQPGNQRSLYRVSFREPHLFDGPFFFGMNLHLFEREREDWDERRIGGSFSIGQHFGDVWRAQITPRWEQVNIGNIAINTPVDVFAVAGDNVISGLAFSVTRNTTDSRLFPTQGSIMTVGIERTGVFGGDFNFTRLSGEFHRYWKVDEDFFGRATVLSARLEVGYIIENNKAPVFERFYAGGHRNFRGFNFRGVGPRGIRNDTMTLGNDPVGGDWLFLAGLEYNWPIYQEVIRAVVFLDTGTVQKNIGFNEYRVSIGVGIRLKVPFFGSAPFAFDLAYPLVKQSGDETQLFSFDIALPF